MNAALIKYEGFPAPDPIISNDTPVVCLLKERMQSS